MLIQLIIIYGFRCCTRLQTQGKTTKWHMLIVYNIIIFFFIYIFDLLL